MQSINVLHIKLKENLHKDVHCEPSFRNRHDLNIYKQPSHRAHCMNNGSCDKRIRVENSRLSHGSRCDFVGKKWHHTSMFFVLKDLDDTKKANCNWSRETSKVPVWRSIISEQNLYRIQIRNKVVIKMLINHVLQYDSRTALLPQEGWSRIRLLKCWAHMLMFGSGTPWWRDPLRITLTAIIRNIFAGCGRFHQCSYRSFSFGLFGLF